MMKHKDLYYPNIINNQWIIGNRKCNYNKKIHTFMKLWISTSNFGIPFIIYYYLEKKYVFSLIENIIIYIILVFICYKLSLIVFTLIYNHYASNCN